MPAPTIYDGLRAYYKFDDSGLPGRDSSGFMFHGTITNGGLVSGGRFGQGFRPSTSAGKMVVADDLMLRQFAATRVSISVWVNLDKALNTMWGTPVFLDKTGGNTRGYFLGVLSGGGNVISFRVHNSAGTAYTASYTEAATSGWIHIVGVYEGSLVRIYRNGVSQNTAAADGTLRHGTDSVDRIGEGFEGIIDELQVWGRMLSSSDVTALYAAGSGLQIIQPDPNAATGQDRAADRGYIELPYTPDGLDTAVPLSYQFPNAPDDIPMPDPSIGWSSMDRKQDGASTTAPYVIRDSPKRIYVDPNPSIVSIEADADKHITAVANGGPTDAEEVITWWEIELLPGQVFVVAERNAHSDFEVNHSQTDEWDLPPNQDWRGLKVRFWMQAVLDASQVWSSDPVTLAGPNFNNNTANFIAPLPPGPPLGPEQGPTRGKPGPGIYRAPLRDNSRR